MTEIGELDIVARRHPRGVVKASITKLGDLIVTFEYKVELSHSDRLAVQRLQQRLTNMDSDFKRYHLAVVDLLDEDKNLDDKQAILDDHDDRVSDLSDCLTNLPIPAEREMKPKADPQQPLHRRLQHVECSMQKVAEQSWLLLRDPR